MFAEMDFGGTATYVLVMSQIHLRIFVHHAHSCEVYFLLY